MRFTSLEILAGVAVIGILLYPRKAVSSPTVAPANIPQRLKEIIGLKSDYKKVYEHVGNEVNVDPLLLQAVALVESNERQKVISWAGACGLMQVLCVQDTNGRFNDFPGSVTWQSEIKPLDTLEKRRNVLLNDPYINVKIGAEILRWNLSTFGFKRGIAVYNRWRSRNESEPFTNQDYVDKVTSKYYGLMRT